jgi:phosphate transport system permease protein
VATVTRLASAVASDANPADEPHAMQPEEPTQGIARPPTAREIASDRAFRAIAHGLAWGTILLVVLILGEIFTKALPAMRTYGTAFLVQGDWDPGRARFGILPQIFGTLYTSILGLAIATVLGLAVAIFLSEGFLAAGVFAILKTLGIAYRPHWEKLPERIEALLRITVELLAAVPSVVYGLWGIFVVIPAIRPMADWLHTRLGWFPLFSTPLSGPGILPASIVLAIMVLPTISAVSRDALVRVPPKLREAAFGLGATRWEAIIAVFIPTAATGIFGSIVLGFGRALGETMALAMLVGNAKVISPSLLSPADTLAALLANAFPEAGQVEVGALMYAALILLAITLVVNAIGTWIVQRATASLEGLR